MPSPLIASRHDEELPVLRPHYTREDVLVPDEVRAALAITSDDKWEDVKARIPWSTAFGARTLRISWGRLLSWMEEHERKTA